MITKRSAIRFVLLALAGSPSSWAASAPGSPAFQVAIRLFGAEELYAPDLQAAKDVAAAILATAGVEVRWQDAGATHPTAETIDVRLLHSTPLRRSPRRLGEALPFAHSGIRITLFLDRVSDCANRNPLFMRRIVGHVLAHEIGHVLQGTALHSRTGVMKANWDEADYFAMSVKNLAFTREDKAAIVSHMAQSRARTTE